MGPNYRCMYDPFPNIFVFKKQIKNITKNNIDADAWASGCNQTFSPKNSAAYYGENQAWTYPLQDVTYVSPFYR